MPMRVNVRCGYFQIAGKSVDALEQCVSAIAAIMDISNTLVYRDNRTVATFEVEYPEESDRQSIANFATQYRVKASSASLAPPGGRFVYDTPVN